jgi:protoporphyrinogen oxidase
MKTYDLVIIGGGLSGLSAALHAESPEYSTLILEASDKPGGRVCTDFIDGFTLDRGFQVLLSGYPLAHKLFPSDPLGFQSFAPGAFIALNQGNTIIADPTREPSAALATLFSSVGTLGDKLKIWKLSHELKKISHSECFQVDGSTMNYLRTYGFSDQVIERFFQPFFGGIFLERDLRTSAGMFRFVFKCFGEGSAVLPKGGMQSLPDYLAGRLKYTEVQVNSEVASVENDGSLTLRNGTSIQANKIILATDPSKLIDQLDEKIEFQSTVTQYFAGSDQLKTLNKRIGLDTSDSSPINNFARLDEVQTSYAPKGKSLWSVTTRTLDDSPEDVAARLAEILDAKESDFEFIRQYTIQRALPIIEAPRYDIASEQTQLTNKIYLAGDYLLNGSIEGALIAGKNAATAVKETLELNL